MGCNVSGNYLLSVGMRQIGKTVSFSPMAYLRAMANPWVMAGIVLLIGWLLAQLSLLSWADLTYILPITATSYVVTAIVGAVGLHEQVSAWRWSGVALIFAGVAVVTRTRPRTAPAANGDPE